MKKETFWPLSRQEEELVNNADEFCKAAGGIGRSELTRRALQSYLRPYLETKLTNEYEKENLDRRTASSRNIADNISSETISASEGQDNVSE